MNDFTKEELIALEDAMEHMLALCRPQDGKSPLRDKLESMIDNYDAACDHEFTRELMQIDLCDKCKSFKFVFAGVNNE